MQFATMTIVASAAVAVFACRKEDDSGVARKTSVKSAFLATTDFQSDKVRPLAGEELINDQEAGLGSLDGLRLNEGVGETAAPDDPMAFEPCAKDIVARVTGNEKVVLSGDVKLGNCMKKSLAASKAAEVIQISKFNMKMFMQFSCEGADLSALDGKSLKEIGSVDAVEELCKTSSEQLFLRNMQIDLGMTVLGVSVETRAISAEMKAGAQPCGKTLRGDEWIWDDGCMVLNMSTTLRHSGVPSKVGQANLSRLTFNGLRESTSDAAHFFSGGTVTMFVNGWEGTLTYLGAETPPTVSLTLGGGVVSGTMNLPADLLGSTEESSMDIARIIRSMRLRAGFSGSRTFQRGN